MVRNDSICFLGLVVLFALERLEGGANIKRRCFRRMCASVFAFCGCVLSVWTPAHVCVLRLSLKSGSKNGTHHLSSVLHLFYSSTAAAVAAILFYFPFLFFFLPSSLPENAVNLVFLKLKNLVLLQWRGSRITSRTCRHVKRIHFRFSEGIHSGNGVWVQHYMLIHNRYGKMRNFPTTIATSVSERISMVGRIGQCVLF